MTCTEELFQILIWEKNKIWNFKQSKTKLVCKPLEALKQYVERVNTVIEKELIVDSKSLVNLQKQEPQSVQ